MYLEILIVCNSTYNVPGSVLGGHCPSGTYSRGEDRELTSKYDKHHRPIKGIAEAKGKRQSFCPGERGMEVGQGCQAISWSDWGTNSSGVRKSLQAMWERTFCAKAHSYIPGHVKDHSEGKQRMLET